MTVPSLRDGGGLPKKSGAGMHSTLSPMKRGKSVAEALPPHRSMLVAYFKVSISQWQCRPASPL